MYLDVEPVEGPGLGHEDPVDPLEDGELGPVPDHDHHLPLGVAQEGHLAPAGEAGEGPPEAWGQGTVPLEWLVTALFARCLGSKNRVRGKAASLPN